MNTMAKAESETIDRPDDNEHPSNDASNFLRNTMAKDSHPRASYFPQNTDIDTLVLNISTTVITKARQRWRFAYVTIMSFQAFLSIQKHKDHCPHYAVIEIEACSSYDEPKESARITSHFSSVEPKNVAYTAEASRNSIDITCKRGSISQSQLTQIVKDKDLDAFHAVGGVDGIANAINSNKESGIHGDDQDIIWRKESYGSNTYVSPPSRSFLSFIWSALKDTTLIILLVCAALALVFGIKEHGLQEGWYEGGSIFLAVFLVVLVSGVSNFKQDGQFNKLSSVSNNIQVDVTRDSRRQHISIFDVLVGDVIFLKIGDHVPADGVLINGYSMQLDESSMTGESEPVGVDSVSKPFLHSGSKVVDGHGQMLVTSVGLNTAWGEMMSSITRDSNEETPLQVRLNCLTSAIGKAGLLVAFLVLVILLARYFTGNTQAKDGLDRYEGSQTSVNTLLNSLVYIVAAAVTIVVVAIPEGLPLAVTLTLAYSMKRMMADQAMVRKLSACETMGSATVICTDKTGTLTLNQMKVTKSWLGEEVPDESPADQIPPHLLKLLRQEVGLNTTGCIYKPANEDAIQLSGSPTEKALLSWAVEKLDMDMDSLRESYSIIQVESFSSEKKRSGMLIRNNNNGSVHVHWKGAAEMILATCSNYYTASGKMKAIHDESRSKLEKVIQDMAASSLRCIAFAHKCVSEESSACSQDEKTFPKLDEYGLTLLGIVGLKDPCRPEVKKAVDICRRAGVEIKMITGDNVFTAKAIAEECSILRSNGQETDDEVIEGVVFRNYTREQRLEKVDKIRVMARSSPLDKLLMVQCLKEKGHVVAVTGDGTNDAPALKEADIGLSMGIQGTEVAKESSDIVILDDNFHTLVTVLRWGRCVYNNIQKFIQFQLTVNVAALVINFVAAASAGEVPLTAVQLLWVNLIMDTLGALALATERPTKELLQRPPVGRTEPLITNIMWRNLLVQALYQIAVLLTLQFKGESIFNVSQGVKETLIFNTFVLCQVFNEFNSRRLQKKNIFEGLHRNILFVGIVGATIILQVVMVEFLEKFANTERLNGQQWGFCILIGVASWPIGWSIKFIPVGEQPFLSLFTHLKRSLLKYFDIGYMNR
ncbi:hypothetical protein Drorol1_Dr00022188 [Drosera rotundifolia]